MAGSPLTKQAIEDQIPDYGTCDIAAITRDLSMND
jgi:hypothetical protein